MMRLFSRFLARPVPPPVPVAAAAAVPKVFCVGLYKTGTSTLSRCLRLLGYEHIASYTPEIAPLVVARNWDAVGCYADGFDAFEDMPWFAVYAAMAARYPDARFILTRRRDGATWHRSAFFHALHDGNPHCGAVLPAFGAYPPLGTAPLPPPHALDMRKRAERAWGQHDWGHELGSDMFPDMEMDMNSPTFGLVHDLHCAQVRAAFAGMRGRLLEVCWEEDARWEPLCAFLDKPVPEAPFPHENKGNYGPLAGSGGGLQP